MPSNEKISRFLEIARREALLAITAAVAEVKASRRSLDAGYTASIIATKHPACGLTRDEVVELLVREAAKQGVAIEITRPVKRP